MASASATEVATGFSMKRWTGRTRHSRVTARCVCVGVQTKTASGCAVASSSGMPVNTGARRPWLARRSRAPRWGSANPTSSVPGYTCSRWPWTMPMRPAPTTAQRSGRTSAMRWRRPGTLQALGQRRQPRPEIALERARIAVRIANGAADVVGGERRSGQDSLQGPGQGEGQAERKVQGTARPADRVADGGKELVVRDEVRPADVVRPPRQLRPGEDLQDDARRDRPGRAAACATAPGPITGMTGSLRTRVARRTNTPRRARAVDEAGPQDGDAARRTPGRCGPPFAWCGHRGRERAGRRAAC